MITRKSCAVVFTIFLASLLVAACGSSSAPAATGVVPPPQDAAPVVEQSPAEEQAPVEDTPVEEEPAPASSSTDMFRIVSVESEVRFRIGEILTGNYNEVVAVTHEVTGEIVADYGDPSTAAVTLIRVDLSTFQTDSSMRDRTVRDRILETADPANQFAEFVSTALVGLPGTIAIGQPLDYQIVGNLTIHGVTREVTFDATVTPVSETRLEGSASTTVQWADFGIEILRLPPQVASVEDDVILEIDFVAVSE